MNQLETVTSRVLLKSVLANLPQLKTVTLETVGLIEEKGNYHEEFG